MHLIFSSSSSFSRSMSFSVILCFPNDYNNEVLSSASTTDAQNILSLNLFLSLHLSCCLISTFSVSLIVVIPFSYQTSYSSTIWSLITSHKYLFQSVCSDFHKFLEVQLSVCFAHCKKCCWCFWHKSITFCSTGFYYYLWIIKGVISKTCVSSKII